jgi:anti-anti-sigma factor
VTDDLFTAEVVDAETEDVRSVAVSGEIDLSNANRFETVLHAAFDGWEAGVLDLSPCSYIDSSGLNALLRFRHATEGRLRLAIVAGASTRRVLEIAGLGALFSIFSSRVEAEESVRRGPT